MFPATYETDPDRRWPVTYYTAGTNHDEATFRDLYGGEDLTASYESLVVTPSGHAGYWSDHDNAGAGGPPMYETFVIDQLIPLIDRTFRTLADRAHRVVLGDSMGGYGALMLAARHPDLFSAASSLSGAVDTNWVPQTAVTTLSPTLQLADIQPPDSIYGSRATQEVRWRGHNPTDLAANLRTVDLQLYTGNGVLGPQESGDPGNAAGCVLEAAGIRPETDSLHATLLTLGVAHRYTAYTWGCHSVALFRQEIVETLARFTTLLAKPASVPVSFSHRFVEPQVDVFGWSVTADPDRAAEFLELREAQRRRLHRHRQRPDERLDASAGTAEVALSRCWSTASRAARDRMRAVGSPSWSTSGQPTRRSSTPWGPSPLGGPASSGSSGTEFTAHRRGALELLGRQATSLWTVLPRVCRAAR